MHTRFMICFFMIVLLGCQKVVTLNLKTVSPQIVIQGDVTDSAGPYFITLSRSVGFYQDNDFPPISGARVEISDNSGVTDSLTETSPGVYATHVLQGTPGNTYTLSVKLGDTLFSAVSTMPEPVPLDSVTFETTGGRLGQARTIAIANFQDPPGIKNYYQFIEYINGVQFTRDIFVFDDRLSDGRYIQYNLRTDSSYLNAGDILRVYMNSIDENVYNYFHQLEEVTSTGAFNTTASPGNPQTNISGGAYGYFSAHTTRSRIVTVK